MTSSRLDRLFVLLETGSSSVTRSAAAKQLGEVQRLHPHELNTLLERTAAYLRSSSWETRVAAAEAVRAIVSHVPQWDPPPLEEQTPEDESQSQSLSCLGRLQFAQFDMAKVLENSTHLMASEGNEFDIEEDIALGGTDSKERMAKQRQLLNARLGLNIAAQIGVDVSGVFSNEDLVVETPMDTLDENATRKPLRDIISSSESTGSVLGLSSREINRARRKARQNLGKQRSKDTLEEGAANVAVSEEPDKKRIKLEDVKEEPVTSIDLEGLDCGDWPLEWFCDQLSQDLFSASWETRHGAATALREVLTVHGRGAGRSIHYTKERMLAAHQMWLEDIAIRLLCVLALDRFGDFLCDAVVAPVRETAAQCLCAVLKLMRLPGCLGALAVLKQLLGQREWEARHGGLLGLKYLLAVREDIIDTLLPDAFPLILPCLSDVDDVGAVAASSLIPVARHLIQLVPSAIPTVVTRLWDLLAAQDELAAACNSFMGLLAAILGIQQQGTGASSWRVKDLEMALPRLFPFLTHGTSGVRKATLQTVVTLTERKGESVDDESNHTWLDPQLLQDALRHVYQRVLVEPLADVRAVAEVAWRHLVTNAGLVELLFATCPMIATWLCLAMQPERVPFDGGVMIYARSGGNPGNSNVNNSGTRERRKSDRASSEGCVMEKDGGLIITQKLYIGGYETTPLATREINAVQVRCMTARMLGLLSCYIVQPAPGVDYNDAAIEKPIDSYIKILLGHLTSKSAQQRLVAGLVIAEWANQTREKEQQQQVSSNSVNKESGVLNSENVDLNSKKERLDSSTSIVTADKVVISETTTGNGLNNQQTTESISSVSVGVITVTENEKTTTKTIKTVENNSVSDNTTESSSHGLKSVENSVNKIGDSTKTANPANNLGDSTENSVNCLETSLNCTESNNLTIKTTQTSTNTVNTANTSQTSANTTNNISTTQNPATSLQNDSISPSPGDSQQSLSLVTHPLLADKLHSCLNEYVYFDEIAHSFTRLAQETNDFLAMLRHYKVPLDEPSSSNSDCPNTPPVVAVLTLDRIQALTGEETKQLLTKFKLRTAKIQETLEERRRSIQTAAQQTSNEQFTLSVTTLAALSSAVVSCRTLPDKLSPVVKPLMDSIRREHNEQLQALTAGHLATLVDAIRDRTPCPNDKILVNLCTFLRCDPEFTPIIHKGAPQGSQSTPQGGAQQGLVGSDSGVPVAGGGNTMLRPAIGNYNGIVTLNNQQRNAERAAYRRSNSASGRGPGRPPNVNSASAAAAANTTATAASQSNNTTTGVGSQSNSNTGASTTSEGSVEEEDEAQKLRRIQRRGATYALTRITSHFGDELPVKLPKLWELMVGKLESSVVCADGGSYDPSPHRDRDSDAEDLLWTLQVLEVTSASVAAGLRGRLMSLCLGRLCTLLAHPYRAVRHLAARCLAVFASLDSVPVMELVVEKVLPLLGATDSDINRQGAVEALAAIVDRLQYDVIPYVVLLIVPLLGRMSDQNQCVRLLGTHTFATLVQLMPLDGGVPEPTALRDSCLHAQRDKERQFLRQLLSPTTIPDYVVPVPIAAELRSYQQCGVNWLAFLNRYRLHGILCDDMGLGKTLQSICILAADHYNRKQEHAADRKIGANNQPSLVICPPTLTGHWVYEVEKFLPSVSNQSRLLKPLQYNGTPVEREKLRTRVLGCGRSTANKYNLVVASYDIVRKDNAFFAGVHWNYVILDEGHIIKNGKTRTSIAVKNLRANHRLILSGTPIQNNVLELWSLFDFLMPGFLGTEKQFTARYSKPILASRDPKCSPKEQEGGALAMEALHRQVLPFLLRRMKEDVLDDLPSKITQDYYCELSTLQEQLYDDFSRSQAHQTLQESLSSGATASSMQGNTHIFQALRYLQNVCNHPKLVLNASHPQYSQILRQLSQRNAKLEDINHSAKLPALKQLLQDCGIGVVGSENGSSAVSSSSSQSADIIAAPINQHRALIFCQLKAMLDIVEHDLLRRHLPAVTYLRLDGAVPPAQRHAVVTRFNGDPSIDVLLLTTQVGGLGLNLTGADTVIFVEHDWNPMKDLQAMDRAHRIGQKKVVNVYRLITRGTLEEKIMGLQKFKVQTANTVISGDNSRLDTMGTEQLLDLFSHKAGLAEAAMAAPSASTLPGGGGATGGASVRTLLETLPDLWDHKQYEDEYDLSQFMTKLSS